VNILLLHVDQCLRHHHRRHGRWRARWRPHASSRCTATPRRTSTSTDEDTDIVHAFLICMKCPVNSTSAFEANNA
jgi:hypothetical protein